MGETTTKLDILSTLSQEFFEEVRKKEESTLTDHFGGPLGRLLWRHGILEDKYTNLAADQMNSVPADGESDPASEELKLVEEALADSTTKLIRQFSKRENQLLLKHFDQKTKDDTEI